MQLKKKNDFQVTTLYNHFLYDESLKKFTNICLRSFAQFKALDKNIADTIEIFGSNKIFTNSLKKIEDIQKTKIKKLLTKIILNGEEYTIISGIYILTDSKSIISDIGYNMENFTQL